MQRPLLAVAVATQPCTPIKINNNCATNNGSEAPIKLTTVATTVIYMYIILIFINSKELFPRNYHYLYTDSHCNNNAVINTNLFSICESIF